MTTYRVYGHTVEDVTPRPVAWIVIAGDDVGAAAWHAGNVLNTPAMFEAGLPYIFIDRLEETDQAVYLAMIQGGTAAPPDVEPDGTTVLF